jgi:hypothetical protein
VKIPTTLCKKTAKLVFQFQIQMLPVPCPEFIIITMLKEPEQLGGFPLVSRGSGGVKNTQPISDSFGPYLLAISHIAPLSPYDLSVCGQLFLPTQTGTIHNSNITLF